MKQIVLKPKIIPGEKVFYSPDNQTVTVTTVDNMDVKLTDEQGYYKSMSRAWFDENLCVIESPQDPHTNDIKEMPAGDDWRLKAAYRAAEGWANNPIGDKAFQEPVSEHLHSVQKRKYAVWDAVRLAYHAYDAGGIEGTRAEYIGNKALKAFNDNPTSDTKPSVESPESYCCPNKCEKKPDHLVDTNKMVEKEAIRLRWGIKQTLSSCMARRIHPLCRKEK